MSYTIKLPSLLQFGPLSRKIHAIYVHQTLTEHALFMYLQSEQLPKESQA